MRSNAGMANRQGDVDVPLLTLWLGLAGLASSVTLHPPAYEDGTNRVFRNVGI